MRLLLIVALILIPAQVAANNYKSPALRGAFDDGFSAGSKVCLSNLENAESELSQLEAKAVAEVAQVREACFADVSRTEMPGFGDTPKNGYLLAVIGSYVSFAALKLVSLVTFATIFKKIGTEKRISAILFGAAIIVLFTIVYAMSGLKPMFDYYLSHGDKGRPLIGVVLYGLPSAGLTFLSFEIVWRILIKKSEKVPIFSLTFFITVVNIASFMALDSINSGVDGVIYPIHVIYLSVLFTLLAFFAFRLRNGFIEHIEQMRHHA